MVTSLNVPFSSGCSIYIILHICSIASPSARRDWTNPSLHLMTQKKHMFIPYPISHDTSIRNQQHGIWPKKKTLPISYISYPMPLTCYIIIINHYHPVIEHSYCISSTSWPSSIAVLNCHKVGPPSVVEVGCNKPLPGTWTMVQLEFLLP